MPNHIHAEISAELKTAGLIRGPVAEASPAAAATEGRKPNILFFLVDEMRFPSVFPEGVNNADEFIAKFMPNLHRLWQKGVKFTNYHTAANACTPARGTLLTGLYSQQTWLCCTLTNSPATPHKPTPTPSLNHHFPTFGKLLREAGYITPYVGKFHVAVLHENEAAYGGDKYGFDLKMYPDMAGFNLQGTIGYEPDYPSDQRIADTAVKWLRTESGKPLPWCLTVSFVNPHDKEFFWAGTEFVRYNNLFESQTTYTPVTYYSTATGNGAPPIQPSSNVLADPPSYGYPAVPPNWESAARLQAEKPKTHYFARVLQGQVWGDASDDPAEQAFKISAYPESKVLKARGINVGIGEAPFSYWQRGLDCYTQTLQIVDERIGQVLDALPADVAENTVIIFASDHGEYAGAHGLLSGKILTAYKEAWHVPLIVADSSGRFCKDPQVPRDGLVSSVDILRLLVSLGHNGSQDWMTGDYEALYGQRHDVLPMLQSPEAPGRDFVLLVTDEVVPGYNNFDHAPPHVIGLQTRDGKIGTYAHWVPTTDDIIRLKVETEYYDYATPGGIEELDNRNSDPIVAPACRVLFDRIVPTELRAPLPASLQEAQDDARQAYLRYELLAAVKPESTDAPTPPDTELDAFPQLGGSF